jgi:hypothetical protein
MNKQDGLLQQAKAIGDEIVNDIARQVQSELTTRAAKSIVDMITDAISNTQQNQRQAYRADHQYQKSPCEFLESVEGMKENRYWSYGGTDGVANPFVLSAQTNHFSYSEPIAELQPDEFFVFKFRVLKVDVQGQFSNAMEILLAGTDGADSGWVFTFSPGQDKIIKGKLKINGRYENEHSFDVPSYLSNQINTLVIYFDSQQGVVVLELNDEMIEHGLTVQQAGFFQIKTRVVGMDACFWG